MVELLINYQYPEHLYATYRDAKGETEWRLAFDPNAQDVTGQTALYVACLLGNRGLVDVILKWRVQCRRRVAEEEAVVMASSSSSLNKPRKYGTDASPTKRRVSYGIQSIMSRLSLGKDSADPEAGDGEEEEGAEDQSSRSESFVNPLQLDLLCGAARETALQAAIRGAYMDVAVLLLAKGADPSVVAKPMEDQNDPRCEDDRNLSLKQKRLLDRN